MWIILDRLSGSSIWNQDWLRDWQQIEFTPPPPAAVDGAPLPFPGPPPLPRLSVEPVKAILSQVLGLAILGGSLAAPRIHDRSHVQAAEPRHARQEPEPGILPAPEVEPLEAAPSKAALSDAIAAHGAPCTFTPLHEACAAHLFR